MFSSVLVGIDLETGGRDAIALALRLVCPSGPGSPAGRLNFAHVSEPHRVGAGLHQLAEAAGADLLVIGSSRAGRSGRVRLSDETRDAVNGAPCAVAVAPLSYAETGMPIQQIGIAYNGSVESRSAVSTARALAAELGAQATAFEALPLPVSDFDLGPWETFTGAVRAREAGARERIARETGVAATASCGETIDEITVFSDTVDLLIVGSRDYGPVGRLVHGSTTHRLLRYARAPMLILTRGARRQSAQQDLRARSPHAVA